jgi:hypothetical protein
VSFVRFRAPLQLDESDFITSFTYRYQKTISLIALEEAENGVHIL